MNKKSSQKLGLNEKQTLESQLNTIYALMNKLDNSKVQETTEFKIMFELENINIKLDIPFND